MIGVWSVQHAFVFAFVFVFVFVYFIKLCDMIGVWWVQHAGRNVINLFPIKDPPIAAMPSLHLINNLIIF